MLVCPALQAHIYILCRDPFAHFLMSSSPRSLLATLQFGFGSSSQRLFSVPLPFDVVVSAAVANPAAPTNGTHQTFHLHPSNHLHAEDKKRLYATAAV